MCQFFYDVKFCLFLIFFLHMRCFLCKQLHSKEDVSLLKGQNFVKQLWFSYGGTIGPLSLRPTAGDQLSCCCSAFLGEKTHDHRGRSDP